MKIYGLKIFGLIGLLFVHNSFGYVYHVCAMKKKQLVIGISDYHDKANPSTYTQRGQIESFLKECDPRATKVIVEDLSSVNNDGHLMCCSYSINGYGGLLGGMADIARALKIDVDNVEYRYCRVVSIGPLLHSSYDQLRETSKISNSVMIDMLYREVMSELTKIKSYNDGTFFNTLYKKAVVNVEKVLKELGFNDHNKQSVANYCGSFAMSEYKNKLEYLCVFDSELIDMNIIHSIIGAEDKSVIVVIAGGTHIEKMCETLQKMGYKKIIAPTIYMCIKQSNIKKTVDERSKPLAIDLEGVVQKLLKTKSN